MVVQKARKQGSVIVRENVIVLYLAHEHSICYKRAAKYRTMTFSLTITDPCFLAFLHRHCLQIQYPTNFLIEKLVNTLTCTKFIWCSYRSLVVTLASDVVFLIMPSRNQKKRSKQRAEYLQK